MSDNPIKLWPGPNVDGHETYFARGEDIPNGWERTNPMHTGDRWVAIQLPRGHERSWYLVRPVELPDPKGTWVPTEGHDEIVTTWGEMEGRADVQSWDRLGGDGIWRGLGTREPFPADYPIRVRRRPKQREGTNP